MNTDFLLELRKNNNREWFNAHKADYLKYKEYIDLFLNKLLQEIYKFDSSIGLVSLKDCTYRIYRDMRFSRKDEPYKTWMGAYICQGGKNSGLPGYYFHIEPEEESDYLGGCLLATGLYCPPPVLVNKIRNGIIEHGETFDNAVKNAEAVGFELDTTNKLQRVPVGYPKDFQYADYLKFKNFCLNKPFKLQGLSDEQLLKNVIEDFRATKDFCLLLKCYIATVI